MIDYGYDAPPHGYDLSGIPIHSIKHEHYKLEDSSVNLIMSKVNTFFLLVFSYLVGLMDMAKLVQCLKCLKYASRWCGYFHGTLPK